MVNGRLWEELIIAKMAQKCDIKRDPNIDSVYKLDFVIDRFKDVARSMHIGVQVTTRLDDIGKQREFINAKGRALYVPRSVYLEIEPDVDVSTFGAELSYIAIAAFAFGLERKGADLVGIRIKGDCSYAYFEVGKSTRAAQFPRKGYEAGGAANQERPERLEGTLFKYVSDRGFGFIKTGQKEDFFFHISDLEEALKQTVVSTPMSGSYLQSPVTVSFQPGAPKNENTAPVAQDIRAAKVDGSTRELDNGNDFVN
ncbi:MAG: hypothetical protein M0Z52_13750 [Actinomycetota bacterium]|nr:hypothetical protein [Actinomycetota bacterium]